MISAKWDITSKCNLRCVHCSVADRYFDGPSRPSALSLAQRLHIVDTLVDGGVSHLSLLGGEPLALGNELFAVLRYAQQRGITTTIVTNGTLLDASASHRIIDSGLDQLVVSIEGPTPFIHEQIRGQGTFSVLMKNLESFNAARRASSNNISLTVNTVLCRPNKDTAPAMIDFCRELGAEEWNLLALNHIGNADKHVTGLAVEDEHTAVAIAIAERLAHSGPQNIKINLQIIFPLVWEYILKRYGKALPPPQICCQAGKSLVYIAPDGVMHVCDRAQGSKFSGHYLDTQKIEPDSLLVEDFETVWRSKKYGEMYQFVNDERTYQRYYPCNRCKYMAAGICNPCPLYSLEGHEIRFEQCLQAERLLAGYEEDAHASAGAVKSVQFETIDEPCDAGTEECIMESYPAKTAGVRYATKADGDAVICQLMSLEELRLNLTANFIWSSLDGRRTTRQVGQDVSELCHAVLARRYGHKLVDNGRLLEATRRMVALLYKRNFVTLAREPAANN